MRRSERERIARRDAYKALRDSEGYWTPKALSPDDYLTAVQGHPSIAELLDYLSKTHREWKEGDDCEFHPSNGGVCEKCNLRAQIVGMRPSDPSAEIKTASDCGFGAENIHFSKYVAEQFALNKEPIILTPDLHREFVYQSWIEAVHVDHVREHMDDPGIAAVVAHPELVDGKVDINLALRAIDGSHRAALAYREGRPFSVRVLPPVESLRSIFAIGGKKNPFFASKYSTVGEGVLKGIAQGRYSVESK